MFTGNRIVLRRIIAEDGLVANSISGDYCNNSLLHTIKLTDSEILNSYLLGILNSKLMGWFFIKYFARDEKTFPEVRIHELASLPIKIIQKNEQQPFVNIVDKIIEKKANNEDTTDLENQIDKLVYELYGLSDDEIDIVERR
jgi:restriction endonuclease S subunit